MGSTSSKEHDANPSELGTNSSQYPMQHHPYYTQGSWSQQQRRSYVGSGTGEDTNTEDFNQQRMYNSNTHPEGDQDSRGGGGSDGKGDVFTGQTSEAMDIDNPSTPGVFGYNGNGRAQGSSQLDSKDGDGLVGSNYGSLVVKNEVVPMVFRWEHGGRNVYITGTFNGWSKQCPMHRSGNDFTYIANLTRGKHAYKFVVDDEWRFAPDQLTVADVEGNVNNYVDVSDFTPLQDFEEKEGQNDEASDNEYGRCIPDIEEYTKEPPPLPPHLRHIILNKAPPSVDCRLLPVPQHVALNHLYCTAIKDGMMVLGITNRYKQKFVTTVYYSLMPGAN